MKARLLQILALLALATSATAQLLGDERLGDSEFLPPHIAFTPVVTALDGRTLEIGWRIEPGYYLYRDKVTASAVDDAVRFGDMDLPAGKNKYDEYFGDTEVYYDAILTTLPIDVSAGAPPAEFYLALGYQGCAEDGICYPPLKRYLAVNLASLTAELLAPETRGRDLESTNGAATEASPPADAAAPATTGVARESIQDRLARTIRDGRLPLVLGIFFIAGLGLALTPCVLPMIPILSGIIAGDSREVTPTRGFLLALTYVLGMALTYTIAGALFAKAGQQAQAVFQQPWILTLFAALFVALALSMFGLYELQMPSAVQSRIAAISGRQKSGTFVGAFIMGALSSLIVTACVAPPLVAALAVIGQGGDVVRGALALFALSIGMGAPLLVVGATAGRFLPRAGGWMVTVKGAFGFVMLGLAIYILERLLPGPVILALWAVLIVMAGVFLGALSPLGSDAGPARKLGKGMGFLALIYGAVLLVGSLTGGHDPLRPITLAGGPGQATDHQGVEFERVRSVAELDSRLAEAAQRGQPVVLDFYADWCVSCKEMEKYTFSDPDVRAALSPALLLQADVTANNDDDRALLARFGLYGPPGIIFFGPDGRERRNFLVVGMMAAEDFAPHVRDAFCGGHRDRRAIEPGPLP